MGHKTFMRAKHLPRNKLCLFSSSSAGFHWTHVTGLQWSLNQLENIFPATHVSSFLLHPFLLLFLFPVSCSSSLWKITSVQFSRSVVSDSLQPHDCSTPGFPVLHYLLELAQIHLHWVSDAIQPSHPLSSPSPPAFNLSQHQGLFKWVCSSHQAAKVLEFQLQHQSFQWIFRTDFL